MTTEKQKLEIRLEKIERKLEKVRGCSPLTHGWQTSKYAKASRSWDELAKEKMLIISRIDELDNDTKRNIHSLNIKL